MIFDYNHYRRGTFTKHPSRNRLKLVVEKLKTENNYFFFFFLVRNDKILLFFVRTISPLLFLLFHYTYTCTRAHVRTDVKVQAYT